ncbi:MAG: ABC transporter ATP-binding protein [bacterium]
MDNKVVLKNIIKKYLSIKGETLALNNINLSIAEDEFVSIVGPSGCGKSTLLSIISGLISPNQGKVLIDNNLVNEIVPQIGYMLQQDYLFDWRTVYENVKLAFEIKKLVKSDTDKKILNILDSYGLTNFINHYPTSLSGGMRQRVALARTLVTNPEILLLDEPFSSLDYQTKLTLEEEMYKILKTEKKTVILVTHDIAEAISMGDRVVILSQRPAVIKKIIKISFPENTTPLEKRNIPKFQKYFDKIWKELDLDV